MKQSVVLKRFTAKVGEALNMLSQLLWPSASQAPQYQPVRIRQQATVSRRRSRHYD